MPYTYYIYHQPTNQHYYGARWAKDSHPSDFWVTYFTSCKEVKRLIEHYGAESFNVQIRRVFVTGEEARQWEHKVLKRLKVSKRRDWINKTNGQPPVCNFSRKGQGLGRSLSKAHKQSISNGNTGKLKGKTQSAEHKAKATIARTGLKRSEHIKQKFVCVNRSRAPIFTFTNGSEVFIGTQADWAEQFKLNRKSAATTFCNGKNYKGWSRSSPIGPSYSSLIASISAPKVSGTIANSAMV